MWIMKFLLLHFALGLCMKVVTVSGKFSHAFHAVLQLDLEVLVRLQEKKANLLNPVAHRGKSFRNERYFMLIMNPG